VRNLPFKDFRFDLGDLEDLELSLFHLKFEALSDLSEGIVAYIVRFTVLEANILSFFCQVDELYSPRFFRTRDNK
jgi:hypothetical protein